MNSNCCNKCNRCDPCGGCAPAHYDCSFNIEASPYDPSTWMVTTCGMMHKVKVPKINETDTKLSTNYSNETLIYNAERHTDIITGSQLGDIINLDYLRDVEIDESLSGHCYELIYRKWAACGDGCRSAADKWMNFNINSDDALKCGIRYVRGANQYGCPVYLDVPTNVNQYWFGMWRPSSAGSCWEFGYVQPEQVNELPKDGQGRTMVLSKNADGKPVYGPLERPSSSCANARWFLCRSSDSALATDWWHSMSGADDFKVTPDGEDNWTAPSCGVLILNYCINVIGTIGRFEIDTTTYKDGQTWSQSLEDTNSTHSTWSIHGTNRNSGVSESCSSSIILSAGECARLHARVDAGGSPATEGDTRHQFRCHAVKAVFIPLDGSGA